MTFSMEWSTFNKTEEESRSKQPQVQIPEFSPSAVGYKFEPVNLHTISLILENLNEKIPLQKKKWCPLSFFISFVFCLYFISIVLNK